MSGPPDDRPVSVRLGEVIPPDDPEDWRRPLTWVAALGMLAAPLVAVSWFVLAPPREASGTYPGTWLLSASVVGGAVVTSLTQRGRWRTFAGAVGAALFAALATIAVAAAVAPGGTRTAAPELSQAAIGSAAGLTGALAAAPLMALLAARRSRVRLAVAPLVIGLASAGMMLAVLGVR